MMWTLHCTEEYNDNYNINYKVTSLAGHLTPCQEERCQGRRPGELQHWLLVEPAGRGLNTEVGTEQSSFQRQPGAARPGNPWGTAGWRRSRSEAPWRR